MINVFIIIDCSGSIVGQDTSKVGMINDIVRDLSHDYIALGVRSIRAITYSDKAEVVWSGKEGEGMLDLEVTAFGGRSKLGEAYKLIGQLASKEKINMETAAIILISDGEATDDYKKALRLIDPRNQSYRVALSIGDKHFTTEWHASRDDLAFKRGFADREAFFDKATEIIGG